MVEIIYGAKTKKELKEMIEKGINLDGENPSIFNPENWTTDDIKEGQERTVTNHPKRSYYATIERRNGKLKVT